jgi:hypothetical protein
MSAYGPSRKSRNVRPESEMRGKTDISGFDYHDGNQAPAHGHIAVVGTRYNTTVPFQAGCRLPTAGRPGAKELMTAVRVSELDGMLAPPAPHPQSFLSKSPSRGFCFYN